MCVCVCWTELLAFFDGITESNEVSWLIQIEHFVDEM